MRKIGWVVFFFAAVFLRPALGEGQILRPERLPFELPGLELNFSGAGAVARGMSGAFVAVSGNLSAIAINPAGLSSLDRPQTALVYRYNRPSVRNRQFAAGSGNPSLDNNDFQDFDQVDFGAFAAPGKVFGHPFVGGAAYTVFTDQFFVDRASFLGPVQVDTLLQTVTYDLKRRVAGKLTGFNLAAATRFGPLSFGAGFQVYQGGFTDTTSLVLGTFYVPHPPDTGYILPGEGRQWLGNKVSYRGSSLILGMQADYKNARLGFAARVPAFTLGETDMFRLRSNMDVGFYDSVFVSGQQVFGLTGGELFFTDARLELPLSLSAGLAYRFGRLLLFDFDYSYTNWGAADLKVRRLFQAPFSNVGTIELGRGPINLTSTHQLRFGWELEFNPGFGQMFVRGGVRNLPVRTLTSLLPLDYGYPVGPDSIFFSPYFEPVYDDSFVLDAQGIKIDTISTIFLKYINSREDPSANGFGASFGVGIRWNQVGLDLAYDFSTYRRTSRALTAFQGELATQRRQRQHRLFVGFTGYFTRL